MVEVLVDFAILSLVSAAVLSAYGGALKALDYSRAKISAVGLANEKMEELRNLPYNSLATQHGLIYPSGDILDNQTFERNGVNLNANTVIACVDDPYDGTSDTDATKNICDFKKIEVTVSKVGKTTYLARLSSDVAAKAAETASDTGIIKICVVDSNNQPVVDANIVLTNSTLTPPLDMRTTTMVDGCRMIPNLPPDSHNKYHMTISKAGYSTDQTYEKISQSQQADQPDANVVVQQVTNQTFKIDLLSTMKIRVVTEAGTPVSSANVHVEGDKSTYIDLNNNVHTKKFAKDFVTNADGYVVNDNNEPELNNMEFDAYSISVNGRIIAVTSPYQPVDLRAGVVLPVTVVLADSSNTIQITDVQPRLGYAGETVTALVKGRNLASNTSVKLVNALGNEIIGSEISAKHQAGVDTLEADFNLTNASVGFYDLIFSNQDGRTITQKDGFEVKQ